MGDVVFIPQGICYYARVCGNTGLKTDTFTINLHFYGSQRQKFLLSERIEKISCCKDTRMELYLKKLSDTFHFQRQNLAKSRGEFLLLLDLVCSCITRNDDFYYRIRKGAELFCKEWNKNEKIEKYAQMCDVSVTYFHRCFKKWSGSSPVEYRNALRLSNAESLLRCTDVKIKEISEMIGYKDPYYFCRLFTDTYGLSPRNYRKCHQ
jgi:AraC-like DNA-binding protein